jgi:ABC-type dipeptide/oligopeptide/nickel transport system permease subunit
VKRLRLIFGAVIIAVISLVQYRLIGASLVSLGTWCALEVGSLFHFNGSWSPALVEYWVAAVVWVAAAVWLVCRIFVPGGNRGKSLDRAPSSARSHPGVVPARIIVLLGFGALTSPFLTLVGPDVQGNLVTTRLLPPLSTGFVSESYDRGSAGADSAGRLQGALRVANNYLLHRIVRVEANAPDDSRSGIRGSGVPTREFRTVFIFGTDDNARDVFCRVVAGARVSLGIGLCSALGALLIGGTVGFAAGVSGGVLDSILMRLTDLFLAIPGLFLVIGILAFIGQSAMTIVLVLSFAGWMGIARVVRGEVASLREREFILAAKLLRVPPWKIIARHFLPNLRPVIVTAAVLQFASAVLGEASLGFLGLGIRPPTATWGNMMGEATGYLASAWWVGVFPGIFLAVVLVSAHAAGENLTGDGNSDATGGHEQ